MTLLQENITLQDIYNNPRILNKYLKNWSIQKIDNELVYVNNKTGEQFLYFPYFPYNPYTTCTYLNQYKLTEQDIQDFIKDIDT